MRKQYKREDLGKSAGGKCYAACSKGNNLVLLSPDVAVAFPTSDAVNEALRGLVRIAKDRALAPPRDGEVPFVR
jgi:hypothetical protein